ncbi:hypothetical protein [Candidatus Binatus sp.]
MIESDAKAAADTQSPPPLSTNAYFPDVRKAVYIQSIEPHVQISP